jgi:pyruvate dehydrogenase E2 component (dihydrolipoamide acetyltransferase)
MLTAMEQPQTTPAVIETAKGETTQVELGRNERTTARRAAEARATVPDVDLTAIADMSWWRSLPEPWAPCPTAALVRAAALALREFPRANGAYRDGRYELYSRVNVGVVVPAGAGQAVPTVFDADRRSLSELEPELALLERRAAADELTSPELAGATFTVANLGARGMTRGTIVPVPPQAAALTAGAVRAVPVVHDGQVVPGRTMELTLVCDHRILYGDLAASVLARIVASLEKGTEL